MDCEDCPIYLMCNEANFSGVCLYEHRADYEEEIKEENK
jgi:hypothetical protein